MRGFTARNTPCMGLVDRRPVVCRNLAMGFWVPLQSKTSSRTPYSNNKQQEKQKHSAENTINFSIDHTGGLKLGSQKGVILAAQNEPKSGVPSIVYIHAGLKIGSAIPYAIHRESNREFHALGT